jgi:hypothetical protein
VSNSEKPEAADDDRADALRWRWLMSQLGSIEATVALEMWDFWTVEQIAASVDARITQPA